MKANDFKATLDALRWRQADAARNLGVSEAFVSMMASGKSPIPASRSGKATELYLTNVLIWDREASDWKTQDEVRGVLLDASSIERIEFTHEP